LATRRSDRSPECLEAPPHVIDPTFGQIDAGQPAASLGEQLMVRAKADANFQHVAVPGRGGVGKCGNERFELVSPAALSQGSQTYRGYEDAPRRRQLRSRNRTRWRSYETI
jgi:hypothetical protein